MTTKIIDHCFISHRLSPEEVKKCDTVRKRAKELVEFITEVYPASREYSVAVTHIETAMFWANAAIARNKPIKK